MLHHAHSFNAINYETLRPVTNERGRYKNNEREEWLHRKKGFIEELSKFSELNMPLINMRCSEQTARDN